jgi:hypothetical protein
MYMALLSPRTSLHFKIKSLHINHVSSQHYTSLADLRKFSKSEKKNVKIAAFLGHAQHLS